VRTAGVVKIHKLLYYCQGWHLAWFGEPLFHQEVAAWVNGPVVADLWHDEDKGRDTPSAIELDETKLSTIDFVVSRYGHLTGKQLIRLTHEEAPWRDVSEQADSFTNDTISSHALQQFFATDDDDAIGNTTFLSAVADPEFRMLVTSAVESPPEGTADDPEEILSRLRALSRR
jgi:uncharacterized phage-associated protein